MSPFNADELLKDEIIVNKFDVAKRQINTAIKMFFDDWDVVSIHTLVSAAHQILHDLSNKKGHKYSIKDSPLIEENQRKDYIKAINLPQNFFKHADKDPDGKLVFRYNCIQFFLYDAIRMYVLLTDETSDEMKVFIMWFQLIYPDLFCLPSAEEHLSKIRKNMTPTKSYKKLANLMLNMESIGEYE